MSVPRIGPDNGIEGTRELLSGFRSRLPYNRLLGKRGIVYPGDLIPSEGTLATLVAGHNESRTDHARVDDLEARVARLESAPPFPAA